MRRSCRGRSSSPRQPLGVMLGGIGCRTAPSWPDTSSTVCSIGSAMTTGRPCSSAGCAPWKTVSLSDVPARKFGIRNSEFGISLRIPHSAFPIEIMGIHTADAIVLRRYPYRETSVLVTCLTDRFGKIKGLVKGLRVPVSSHRSAMEPLTLNRLVFYDTRSSSLHLISQCDLLEAFPSIQRELEGARAAASCIEGVDAVLA